MARCRRLAVVAVLCALGATLPGCAAPDFMDKLAGLEIFSQKTPLPGQRQPVFPSGVPGVSQGVPPDLVRGYQPPAEPRVAAEPDPNLERAQHQRNPHSDLTKPRPAPRRVATRPPPPLARAQDAEPAPPMARPAAQLAPAPRQTPPPAENSPWPATPSQASARPAQQQASPWPATPPAATTSPWPEPPAAGTFSR